MLSVIVPTYNEKENVEKLYLQVNDALSGIPYELLFMDDSTDETPQIIEALMSEHDQIRMIHRDTEKGLATAVVLGFQEARGDYLTVMDGDLQHPPKLLRSMYACLESGYEVCLPSRFVPGGSDGGLNLRRKFISWTARKIGNLSLRSLHRMSDVTGGYFMIRKKCLEGADLRPIGWKILVEVLATANYSKVCEIPYAFQERNAGESKISLKVTLEYLKQLLELKRRETGKCITPTVLTESKTTEFVQQYCPEPNV